MIKRVVSGAGLEPALVESESTVLPLDEPPVKILTTVVFTLLAKYTADFITRGSSSVTL